jgi:protein-disulfide isomerase
MSNDSGMSKRQVRREKMRRAEMRSRLVTIGLVVLGALVIAFVLIYPNFRPAPEVVTAEPRVYPQAEKNAMGDPDAPVKIDVFEDYQCPACLRYTQEIEPLVVENYVATGKVYYVFHNYPFIDGGGASNGGESDQTANAAMCATEQGKFWEMHDIIFANWNGENQGTYSDRLLTTLAEKIGLDMDAFNACFEANKYKSDIQADFDLGVSLGVNGTPSVFVDQVIIRPGYVPSYDDISKAVEDALAGK